MTDRVLRLAAAALIVSVGVWTGARVYSIYAARTPGAGMAIPAGEASALTPDTMPPAAKIPDRLPDFSLKSLDGKATSIKTWGGKSLVINFWATWCAPCRREIPLLEDLYGEWSGRDVAVIGIAVDHQDQVASYANELKIVYPVLIGEQDALDVAAAFGVRSPALPFTVFTDRRGELVALYMGELHKPEADLILSVVQDLNRNQLALPQARRTIADGLQALLAARPG